MDRGKNQASISYERRLAERTASRISKPETVKKQVGFKTEAEKKSGQVKRVSPKLNEDRHGDNDEDGGKKTSKDDTKVNHVNEHVFHTHNSGLAFSATVSSAAKKTAAGRADTASSETSRRRMEFRQMSAIEPDTGHFASPLKKSQMEIKELKSELSKLSHEIDEKNEEIANLKSLMQISEEKDRQIEELEAKLRETEQQMDAEKCRIFELKEELTKMDERFTALKVEFAEKEEKFEAYLMNMYKKGLEAARFEREEELEMLAKSNKSNVTVKELTRKLSRTESELAKWQGLRLEESYFNSQLPRSEGDATLSFVRDSFLHFMSDSSDIHEHLKALLKIFKYSDEQLGKVWKGLEAFKNVDRRKIMDRIDTPNGTSHGKNGH